MSFARVRALTIVGALFACAVIFVVMALVKDTQTTANTTNECPAGFVQADLRLPEEKNIKIRVYNATDRQSLADGVAADFENREFTVVNRPDINKGKANNPLGGKPVTGVVALRYGPKGVGSAWVVRAYFIAVTNENFTAEFDLKRADDPATKDVDEREIVDVIVGAKFQKLGTVTEVNQSLAALGTPELPKGTCNTNAR